MSESLQTNSAPLRDEEEENSGDPVLFLGGGGDKGKQQQGVVVIDGKKYYPVDHPRGWFTVLGAFLVQFVVFGLIASFPVFIHALKHDDTLDRPTEEDISVINGVASGPGFFLGWMGGAILDRVGPRPLLFFVVTMIAFALLVTPSVATSYQGIIGAYSVPITIACGFANSPVSAAVGSWFDKYLELGLGIGTAGGGLGSALLPLFSGHFVTKYGWRTTWRYLAVFDLLMLAAAFLCSRREVIPGELPPPSSSSSRRLQQPDDEEEADEDDDRTALISVQKKKTRAAKEGGKEEVVGISYHHRGGSETLAHLGKVLRLCIHRNFLVLFFSGIFFGFCYTGIMYAIIPLALSYGKEGTPYVSYEKITVEAASGIYTWFGIANAIGALIFGLAGYHLDPKIVYILSNCTACLGILGLAISRNILGLSLSFCLAGGAYAGNWAMFPALITERFDGPLLGTIMGLAYMGIGLGALITSPILAVIASSSGGSWYPGLGVLAVMALFCGVIAIVLPKANKVTKEGLENHSIHSVPAYH